MTGSVPDGLSKTLPFLPNLDSISVTTDRINEFSIISTALPALTLIIH